MLATVKARSSSLRVVLTPEEGDKTVSGKARAGRRSFSVWAPAGLNFDDVHPDLVALSVFLVAHPWTANRLVMTGVDAISDTFAQALHSRFGTELHHTGTGEPRLAPAGGRSGLAFSGGVDSTAAMMLMLKETPLLFLNRVGPDRTPSETRYQSVAALSALDRLSRWGHQTYAVDTDLEYTRRPTGFPTHWANAIPAILFADQLGLHSISWGMILESAYGVGSSGFQDWSRRPQVQKLCSLSAAAGLPVSLVVGGLSEVATSKMVLNSRYASIAQSCIVGSIKPCGECKKCFRKGLLDQALSSPTWRTGHLRKIYRVDSVRRELSAHPLHHENVYGFLLSNYSGSDPILTLLKRQVRAEMVDYTLFDRYYSPFLNQVHPTQRGHVSTTLNDYLDPMTEAQEQALQSWHPTPETADSLAHQQLLAALERHSTAPSSRWRTLQSRLRLPARLGRAQSTRPDL